MNQKTYYLIADIIQRYRTWIEVKDTEKLIEMRLLQDGMLKTLFYKGLSLQSYRDKYSFKKTRTWNINEYDLNQGLVSLCKKDPTAKRRIKTHSLTLRDVEYIILANAESIGIVTPYNNQVDAFNRQLNNVKAGTIHKYQGREEDTIIMSVVDNQISEFADDAKMLNVAVSRAQKRFCLVVTGNEQEKHSNIMDLLDYIAYNNCIVTESKLASIFDYLYEQYTEQRMAFLESHAQISEFASENLTYALISEVLASDSAYSCLKVICHIPLRQVVKDTSMMSTEELKYASNYNTHLDFLIINKVSKQPVLAIETDGYSYHNDETEQHKRDMMKDHILSNYGLPLLRLSTKGSGEREKIITSLSMVV